MGKHLQGGIMKIVAIITSRWQSTRLPGKALVDIGGKPMLQRIVDIANQSKYIDEVVVATTPSSEPIIQYCKKHNISFYAGSEEDILSRLYETAKQFNADILVRLWGDAPLIELSQINSAVAYALSSEDESYYISLSNNCGVVSVMSFTLLELSNAELHREEDRHWFHKYLNDTKITVDTQEDLERVRELWVTLKR